MAAGIKRTGIQIYIKIKKKEATPGRGDVIANFEKMKGQLNIFDYLSSIPVVTFGGCGQCICKKCLYWWSGRCPNGGCFDDKRAVEDPYDRAHPDKPPRTLWSNWNKPGEQAHWCRGGVCYPVYHCNHFLRQQKERNVKR